MKKFEKIFFSMIAMIMMMAVGSVFTSCTNDDDDFRVPAQEAQLDQALGQDSVASMTRGITLLSPLSSTPSGWTKSNTYKGNGVQLYTNSGSYLIAANLKQGAKFGMVFEYPIQGAMTGDAVFTKLPISSWNSSGTFFACAGSQYFSSPSTSTTTTKLPFFLKQDNQMYSYGTGGMPGTDTNRTKRALIIDDDNQKALAINVGTNPMDYDAVLNYKKAYAGFVNTSGNSILSTTIRRTFVGILDDDGDGKNEVVLLLISYGLNHSDAWHLLTAIGCSQSNIVTFDGGASSQLICKNVVQFSNARTLPGAFVVKEAP